MRVGSNHIYIRNHRNLSHHDPVLHKKLLHHHVSQIFWHLPPQFFGFIKKLLPGCYYSWESMEVCFCSLSPSPTVITVRLPAFIVITANPCNTTPYNTIPRNNSATIIVTNFPLPNLRHQILMKSLPANIHSMSFFIT